MKHCRLALATGLMWVAASTSCPAVLLNFSHPTYPDLFSDFVNVTYNATTDQFVAQGFAESIALAAGPTTPLFQQTFIINATINASGVLQPGGTISIGTGGSYLTGNLTQFGWDNISSNLFDFAFTPTGGTYAGSYGSLGYEVLDAQFDAASATKFKGNFNSDFSNIRPALGYGIGLSHTFKANVTGAVPEPSTLFLMLTGGCGLWMVARNARRRFASVTA